jgi:hypothetical protein
LSFLRESSWKPRSKNISSSSKAPGVARNKPTKKQNRRKQSEPTAKPQQRQQQTKEGLPFEASVQM